uniref:Uncharacterized protein n=1 Tax=Tanacetum cinerariifolium TaxID=118510 RepID=A0A6L2N6Q3_TANCI|nr:hypothetical protein [Tanacetum cinerariifolium]
MMGEQTIKEYMAHIRDDTGPGVVRLAFGDAVRFKLKGKFLKELCDNTFIGTDNKDANKHIDKEDSKMGYQEKSSSLEEKMSKFVKESTKRNKDIADLIMDVRASTESILRNQEAPIKIIVISHFYTNPQ